MLCNRLLKSLFCASFLLSVSVNPVDAAPIDTESVTAELQAQTTLPIWLPDDIPAMEQVYTSFYTSSGLYIISFDYTADCQGSTVCSYGSFAAERDGEFFTMDDLNPVNQPGIPREEVTPIQFENGMSGQYVHMCGAYCTALVQWRLGGILYSATIKNGTKEAAVSLANNILQGNIRN